MPDPPTERDGPDLSAGPVGWRRTRASEEAAREGGEARGEVAAGLETEQGMRREHLGDAHARRGGRGDEGRAVTAEPAAAASVNARHLWPDGVASPRGDAQLTDIAGRKDCAYKHRSCWISE